MQVTRLGKVNDPGWGEPPPWRTPEFWDRRASSFAVHDTKSGYAEAFMEIVDLEPDWSVLDVGSATGTLAIPLAGKAQSITALDFSSKMLEVLRRRCDDSDIGNIRTVHGRWEDDWDSLGINPHDVAIASRSMPSGSARAAIAKLNKYARKRVYVVVAAGNGPRDRRVYEAIGRDFNPPPHYGEINLMLAQQGFSAGNAFISYQDTSSYGTHAEAFEFLKRSIPEISPQEEEMLQDFLRQSLVLKGGRWKLYPVREIRWAVIWWDTDMERETVMSSITAEI